jgi:hypothetical protein
VVIDRQKERIGLLKAEVERRGGRWHETDVEETQRANGHAEAAEADEPRRVPGGGLTNEELRRQLEEQMGDEEEDAMHLWAAS